MDTKTATILCKSNPEMGYQDYKFSNPGSRDWEFNPGIANTTITPSGYLPGLAYGNNVDFTRHVNHYTMPPLW